MTAARSVQPLDAGEQARLAGQSLTYGEVGATLGADPLPAGYHHVRRRGPVIGRGPGDLDRLGDAVLGWQVQLHSGLRVYAEGPAAPGVHVVLRLGPGRVSLRIPCRVVAVVDEPRRRGFAYGTLPGHPETGEEAFVVALGADEAVRLEVVAFLRQAWWAARLGAPAARAAEWAAVTRYLRALR